MATYSYDYTWQTAIETQGDTSTASVISIKPLRAGRLEGTEHFGVRVNVCDDGTYTDATNATIAATSGWGDTLETAQANKDITFVCNAAVAATETLTLTDVVIDGETFTIGSQVYEIDTDGSVTGSNVSVDVSSHATASQGTLTVDTQPTIGDTMTVGVQTYAFVAEAAANSPAEIGIGADLAGAQGNIVAAINGTDGWNTANAACTAAAFSGNNSVLTAAVPGTAGDAHVTTETFTAGTNVFDAATLGTTTAGVDCTAANADGEIISAINGDGSAVVSAAQGGGTTVDITADTAGTAANSYATTETMANASFGAATMSGGEDAVTGEIRVSVTNATAETVTLRLGPPNLEAIQAMDYCGAELDITHAAP